MSNLCCLPGRAGGSPGYARWLPEGHDCCLDTTRGEHLTLIPASRCLRRFFATPLHKSLLRRLMATVFAKAKENWVFVVKIRVFRGQKTRLGKQVRDGRQDRYQKEIAEPSRHRRPGTGAASLLSLRHGPDHPADSPAV